MEPLRNGSIAQQTEVQAAEHVSIGFFDHYQVLAGNDAEMCAWLNERLRAFHSTERIGPPGDSNDPARFGESRSVTLSRTVDEEGYPCWAVIASL